MKLSSKLSKSRIFVFLVAALAALGIGVAAAQPALAAPLSSLMHSSASSHPVLRYGAHGSAVKSAQRALNKHGAHLKADGVFGPATLRAVKSFQRSHGLSVDGIVGPNTWSHLGASGSSAPTSPTSNLTRLGISQAAINGARRSGASLDVSKRTSMMYFLRSSRGKVYVSRSSVVSFAGCNADGCFRTPNGVFHVVKKGGANERSIPWHGASMPYPVYFTWSGYAMHYDPLEPSHGCIHDPNYWQMKYIHDVISIGDVFVVHS